MQVNNILNFHCPRWNELPDEPLFNREIVSYINEQYKEIVFDSEIMTQTMVQNYSKWGVIPKIEGRKYSKKHLAYLMIIAIYKQILSLEQLKKGLALQLNLMDLEDSYNNFANILENALHTIFCSVKNEGQLYLGEQQFQNNTEGVSLIAYTYALKLLGNYIIQQGGYDKIKER